MTEPAQASVSRPAGEPDWGCAEFRETIAWMRARWPELAAEAEHPMLEAYLADGLHKQRPWLRPIFWFRSPRKDLLWALLQSPLSAREMLSMEIGCCAGHAMNMQSICRRIFWFLMIGVGHLILAVMAMFKHVDWNEWNLRLDPPTYFAMLGGVIVSGFLILMAAWRHRMDRYQPIKRGCKRFRVSLQRAAGIYVDPIKKRLRFYLVFIGLSFLTIAILLMSAMNISIAWVLIILLLCWIVITSPIALVYLALPVNSSDREKFRKYLESELGKVEKAHEALRDKLTMFEPTN